jgi:serine/threonine protein kinase
MKVIHKGNTDRVGNVYNEVKIMQELDHPHIAKLFDFFEDEENIYLIME